MTSLALTALHSVNAGSPRHIPRQKMQGVKVHRSVKLRMEAENVQEENTTPRLTGKWSRFGLTERFPHTYANEHFSSSFYATMIPRQVTASFVHTQSDL